MTTTTLRKVRSLEYVLRASVTPCSRSGTSKLLSRSYNNLQIVHEDSSSNDDDDPPPTSSHCLSKTRFLQGCMLLFAIVALLNCIIQSCILALISPNSLEVKEIDMYSMLSTEVILPLSMILPSSSRGSSSSKKRRLKRSKKQFGVSLATISGIIDFVGPILPFAGGIDLRKLHPYEVYLWMKSVVFATTKDDSEPYAVLARSRSSSGMVMGTKLIMNGSRHDLKQDANHVLEGCNATIQVEKNQPLVLGASEPFLSLEEIAELNLEDVAFAFQLSREPEDDNNSSSTHSKQVKSLVNALQEASAVSRGHGVNPAVLPSSPSRLHGDLDASLFCAALRIFAEWRMLRTVPEGYKSYSVGMALGLKDVVQNIAKVEVVMRELIEVKSMQLDDTDSLRGPTVRELLEYERDLNVHPNLPRLNGGAAIGLLWSFRQLLYQSSVFQNILDTPNKYQDTKTAVGAAYKQVYGKYHGWAVQQIFNLSFRSAPDASLIFNMMDTVKLRAITTGASRGSDDLSCEDDSFATDDTMLSESETLNSSFVAELAFWDAGVNSTEDEGRPQNVESLEVNLNRKDNDWLGNLLHHAAKIVDHIDKEFSKVGEKLLESQRLLANWGDMKAANIELPAEMHVHEKKDIQIFDEHSLPTSNYTACTAVLEGPELQMYISHQMERHIRTQISHYLNLMKPITFDLGELFEELNMNDPSKV